MSVKTNGNMADKLGTTASEKNKWHLDCLLEKLRQQQQNKTFQELSKSVRMSLLEKRYAMDAIEKANLQKTLDNLQQYIQVKNVTRTWLVERLESLSRQLGLKFMIDNGGLFISSDMFYIEINLNPDDTVKEVNVHHEGAKEHYPCKELVTAISKGDFIDLTSQLEGLISIYQINAEKSVKCKAFVALQALETDLANFSLLQASMTKDNYQMCMHSPLGLLQKRRGGHPMQITYFVSAYDLIDMDRKQFVSSLTNDLINTKKIGNSVTVNLEASAATRLQIQPLLLINTDVQNCTTSAYSQMNQNNSCLLPATFVLRLNKPCALGCQIVQEIERITEQKLSNHTKVPLMALIVNNASEGKITNIDRSMFVSLPDQNHCYFLSEMKEQAIQVTNIPFSDPQHVPKVIKLLRQQALFNTLIGSCVRTNCGSPKDFESLQMFEITALSSQYITVALEHPYQQQLITIEFDLSDIGNIGCQIYGGTQMTNISNKMAKVIQTCKSIPVTMRYLMKSWQQEYARVNLKKFDNSDNYNMSLGSNDPGVEDDEYDPLGPSSNDNDYSQNRYLNSNETSTGNGGHSSDRIAEAMEKICGKPIKMEEVEDMFDESNTSCDSFSLAGTLESNPASTSSYDFDPKEVLEGPPSKKIKTEISITPIPGSQNQYGQNVTLERRPGIEIIPISSANAKDLPASITITPINNSKSEKRSSSGSSDGKSEKKKKRKREDSSQMGPPDPLSKPVSLHHLASGSSPIHRNSSGNVSSSAKQSPKHSPVHSASPKHQGLASSPKHSISSPKHSSGASSGGKPSMSALKSAANSPKSLSLATSPSLSSMSSSSSPSANVISGENGQAKNRKGSLTAVIDKLKSNAQSDDIFQYTAQSSTANSQTPSSASASSQSNTSNNAQNTSSSISNNSGSSSSITSAPNQSCTPVSKPPSEYMVKNSSDGMKITINKTKSKDKSSSGLTKSASFTSGSNSPKIHTGLKPGVNSGPASKKPSIGSSSKSSGVSGIQKLPFQKSSSSGNLSSGSGKVYSPSKSSSSSGSVKEKSSKSSKSSSSSSISSSSSGGTEKYRTDTTDIMKMLGFSTAGQGNDSFMKSSKFQIPKISARTTTSSNNQGSGSSSGIDDYRKDKSASHSAPNTPSMNTNTSIDFSSKLLTDFNKYPMSYSAASKLPGDISPMHVPSAAAASLNKMSIGSSPKYNTQADTREAMNLETYHSQKLNSMGLSFPGSMHSSSESLQEKAMENMKFQQQQQQQQRSATPSHSVHATVACNKSPSPLIIIPSPRSTEHTMGDDDNLMEELVAITK